MGLVSRAGGIPFQEPAWPLAAHSDRHLRADRFDLSRTPPDRIGLKQVTWEARIALEEAAVAATRAAQRALTVAAVLDQALTVLEGTEDGAVAAPRVHDTTIPTDLLNPREREVLALVAEGRSNKAIAEAPFVSPNTIKTHVTSLLHKLHADTRVQLAALAVRGGLRQPG
jgi:DNA-binding NarL/FixJ family response regulator